MRVSVSTSEPTRPSFGRETSTVGDDPSPRRIHRDSIELVDFSAVSQGITRHSQVWEAVVSSFSDGIVKSRSTEIEHGLLRPVTLHQVEDGIHWFCHEILPELNGLSPSKRLRFVAIYRSEALYSNRTHTFIGFLGLYRTQRLVTSSRRS